MYSLVLILIGQLPIELDKSSYYLQDLPTGNRVRTYSDAMKVDRYGNCWLQANYVVDNRADRNKELEIINNRLGWIVRVHPSLRYSGNFRIMAYPQWERNYVPRYGDLPVKGIVVVKPVGPYRVRPTYVRINVNTTFGY